MVYQAHYLVRLEGTVGPASAPLEIWSTGFQIGAPGGPASTIGDLPPATLTAFQNAAFTFFGSAGLAMDSNFFWTVGKVSQINTEGKVAFAPQFFSPGAPKAGGASGGPRYPLQTTAVASLIGQAEVHRRMGRMYLPFPRKEIDSLTYGISVADRNAILTSVVGLLGAFNVALGELEGGMRVVIAGQERKDGSPAFNSEVKEVRVGNILDTQRRRRNNLPESYGLALLA